MDSTNHHLSAASICTDDSTATEMDETEITFEASCEEIEDIDEDEDYEEDDNSCDRMSVVSMQGSVSSKGSVDVNRQVLSDSDYDDEDEVDTDGFATVDGERWSGETTPSVTIEGEAIPFLAIQGDRSSRETVRHVADDANQSPEETTPFVTTDCVEETFNDSSNHESEEADELDYEAFQANTAPVCASTPFTRAIRRKSRYSDQYNASYLVGNNTQYTYYETACTRYFDSMGLNGTKNASTIDIDPTKEEEFKTPEVSKSNIHQPDASNIGTIGPFTGLSENNYPKSIFDCPKILQRIIRCFPQLQSVLQFRLVNKQWRKAAHVVLAERNKLCLRFQGSTDTHSSVPNSKASSTFEKVYHQEKLQELATLLQTSTHFPIHRFVLREVDLQDPSVQNFFKSQGPLITHMSMKFRPDTLKNSLWLILKKHLPHVVILELLNLPVQWKKDSYPSDTFLHFRLLQALVFGETPQEETPFGAEDLIQSIIRGSEKLAHILNFPVHLNAAVQAERKVHVIKTLNFQPDPRQEGRKIENYLSLTATKHRLVEISIKDLEKYAIHGSMSTEEGTCLESLLYINRKSLETIHTQPLGFCIDVHLRGKFTHLKTLHLHCFSAKVKRRQDVNTSFFPNNLVGDLPEKFPKLTQMLIYDLECKYFTSDFPSAVFDPESFPWVKSLTLDFVQTGTGSLEEWSRFACIMPNVTHLTLKVPLSALGEILSKAWRSWQNLERVTIHIKEDGYNYTFAFLDEIITGLEEKHCRVLRNNMGMARVDMINNLRNKHSVLDLKHLKSFEVVFECQADYEKHINGTPSIISHIASWYGFHHMHVPVTGSYSCKRT